MPAALLPSEEATRLAAPHARSSFDAACEDAFSEAAYRPATRAPGAACPANPPQQARDRKPGFFAAPSRAAALDAIVEGVRAGEPFIVLTGESGLGKTALLDAARSAAGASVQFLRLGNPLSSPLTLGRILIQLGSSEQDGADDAELDAALRAVRAGRHSQAETVVIAVEEAETLQPPALSLLGLLPANSDPGLLRLQVLLVGGPSLLALLARERFPLPTSGRIGAQVAIKPLDAEEVTAYIEHELQRMEAADGLPGPEDIARIIRRTGGNPRSVNAMLEEILGRGQEAATSAIDCSRPSTDMPACTALPAATEPIALAEAAVEGTTASHPISEHLGSDPVPLAAEEGSWAGVDDYAPPLDGQEAGADAWTGHRSAGLLIALAICLCAALAMAFPLVLRFLG